MKTQIAFDVSGLAWKYRSGVQNLYWAYIDAFAKRPEYLDSCDITFYDRSGIFNHKIASVIPGNYQSCAPRGWPEKLRRPMQAMVKMGLVPGPNLKNHVNQVWNWDIFNPSDVVGSITIPDILPIEYPHWFSSRFQRQTDCAIKFAADKAQLINCISDDVRIRLAKYAGIDLNRIKVVYPGIDQAYFSDINPKLQDQVLNKFNLTKKNYLLSSGFLDPRKNLKRQIQAFGMYTQKHHSSLQYVLTGLKTNLSKDILDVIENSWLRERVIFLGYITTEELRILTSVAACLMYCSIAEGFGLPILEAMALGVPVVTSNTSSMEELAKGRSILANPESVESISQAIAMTIEASGVEQELQILSNKEYAGMFTTSRWLKNHVEPMLLKSKELF